MRPDLSPEDNVRFMVEVLGMDEDEARFIVAIETGEIDGDVIELDEHGNEVRRPIPRKPTGPPALTGD